MSIEQLSGPPIPGVKQHASGLYVPEELSRAREVWTYQEWKILDKAAKLLSEKGVTVAFFCDECKMPLSRVRRNDGGMTLRCNHKDREFHKL